MPKILACFAFLLLCASPSYAQWERVVIAWTGKSDPERPVTHGSPHPLRYYLTPSADRDPINSLCLGCPVTAGGRKQSLKDFVVEASQRPLGVSFGKKIIEVVLSFRMGPELMKIHAEEAARENGDPGRVYSHPDSYYTPVARWKSIIMESSANEYQELYLLIDVGVFVPHLSYGSLLTIEGSQILGIADFLQGNGGICWQEYWVLEHDGPWLIDFSAVDKEMNKLIPLDATVVPSCPSLASGELEMSDWIEGKCHACGLGMAVVRFRLHGHRAMPVASRFEPEQEPPQPN